MSPLPQRKKSAEEIAKLRESLGIPGAAGEQAVPPAEAPLARPETPSAAALGGEPPFDPPAEVPIEPFAEPDPELLHRPRVQDATAAEPPTPRIPKPVRSLKRSERESAPQQFRPAAGGGGEGKLPERRRSDQELNELRRRQAFEIQSPVVHLQAITAHPALLILGYLLSLAGGVGGLLIAAWIFFKKPRSRHHASFMAMIALFVIVFGALYLFPHLRHAA